MSVTIKEIAAQEGVSPTTVFRALHDQPRISPDTRKRILEKAKQLTYKTNPLGKNLRLKKSFLVGVLMPDVTTSLFPQIIQGSEEILDEAGYSIILRTVTDRNLMEKNVQILLDKHVDGLVVSYNNFPFDDYTQLQGKGLPVIFLSFKVPGVEVPYVCVDNVLGGYLATRHLIERGHKKIYYVNTVPSVWGMERFQGYQKVLAENRIPFNQDLIISNFSEDVLAKILTEAGKPVAFFASTDMIAAKTIAKAYDLGLNPFKDLAVVGFDDLPLASIFKPTLTTIAQPTRQMGAVGAVNLINLMKGREVENVVLKPELVVRESTQACIKTERRRL